MKLQQQRQHLPEPDSTAPARPSTAAPAGDRLHCLPGHAGWRAQTPSWQAGSGHPACGTAGRERWSARSQIGTAGSRPKLRLAACWHYRELVHACPPVARHKKTHSIHHTHSPTSTTASRSQPAPAQLPGTRGLQHKLLHHHPPLLSSALLLAAGLPCCRCPCNCLCCCDWPGQDQPGFGAVHSIAGSRLLAGAAPHKAAAGPHPENAAHLRSKGGCFKLSGQEQPPTQCMLARQLAACMPFSCFIQQNQTCVLINSPPSSPQ